MIRFGRLPNFGSGEVIEEPIAKPATVVGFLLFWVGLSLSSILLPRINHDFTQVMKGGGPKNLFSKTVIT